jgi:hypothetical protein
LEQASAHGRGQPRAAGGKKEGPEAFGGVCSAPAPRPRTGRMLHLYFTKRGEGVVARSLCTAWRPATCTKWESSAHSAFVAHSNPRAPGSALGLCLTSPASRCDLGTLLEAGLLAQWRVTGRHPLTSCGKAWTFCYSAARSLRTSGKGGPEHRVCHYATVSGPPR